MALTLVRCQCQEWHGAGCLDRHGCGTGISSWYKLDYNDGGKYRYGTGTGIPAQAAFRLVLGTHSTQLRRASASTQSYSHKLRLFTRHGVHIRIHGPCPCVEWQLERSQERYNDVNLPCYEAQVNHGPEAQDREFSESLVHDDLIVYIVPNVKAY